MNKDFTINDINVKEKPIFVPNWFRAGYKSRNEAIDAVMEIVKREEYRFAALGLNGQVVKKAKKR